MSYYQTIYNILRQNGLSKAGALGLLGNWDCESNCEPCRVQGDFQASRAISKSYAAQVDSGSMSRDTFMRDQKGFGLAQWTYYTRKAELYDFAKANGKSIGDCELQVKFALNELRGSYSGLLTFLKSTDSALQACKRVCEEYERPAANNIDARYQAALRIAQGLQEPEASNDTGESNKAVKPAGNSSVEAQEAPKWATMPAWAPGVLNYGDVGAEVRLMQDILTCRDYYCTPDGIFGKNTESKLKAFQSDAGLDADGSCGPVTWEALKW